MGIIRQWGIILKMLLIVLLLLIWCVFTLLLSLGLNFNVITTVIIGIVANCNTQLFWLFNFYFLYLLFNLLHTLLLIYHIINFRYLLLLFILYFLLLFLFLLNPRKLLNLLLFLSSFLPLFPFLLLRHTLRVHIIIHQYHILSYHIINWLFL